MSLFVATQTCVWSVLDHAAVNLWFRSIRPISWIFFFAALFAALCSALSLPLIIEGLNSVSRRTLRKQRLINGVTGGGGKESLLRDVARNGLPLCRLPSTLILKTRPWSRVAEDISCYFGNQLVDTDPEKVSELMFAACLMVAVIARIVTGELSVALVAASLVPTFMASQARRLARNRAQQMREQLPDALQCMGFCFMAGCSLEQAIEQTAEESTQPLKQQLEQVSDDIQSGLGVSAALAAFERRNDLPEISFITATLEIQHQTGGSLKDLLEAAATSVRNSITLKRQLQAQTAQARLSFKVVALMPVFLIVTLSLTVKGYAASFLGSVEGLMILVVAIGMELSGIMLIRKILGVEF